MDAEGLTPRLAFEDLTVHVNGLLVLDRINFEVGSACLLGVLGPNGSGKSTLFNTIASLIRPTSGRVLINGRAPEEERGQVAYMTQYERINTRIPMSAWDVVMQGRVREIGWFRWPGRSDREIVRRALETVEMSPFSNAQITEMSGGQRKRVFIARALAQGASILLLDEPFSGVDIPSQSALLGVLLRLRDDGHTILMSSHDIIQMFEICDDYLPLNCEPEALERINLSRQQFQPPYPVGT
ncbi:MAG: ABC transporter ATP-binding protein [Chloroflexi bacterium]|nr:ABC transporter ATP-binding protein [Chloroflexota bacterium]